MRRRPFKFFFALTLGIMLFFFVARVFVFALLVAAVMSTIFFIGRKVVNFFRYMTWRDEYEYEHPYRFENRNRDRVPAWRFDEESALQKWDREWALMQRERIIEVR